MAQPIFWIVFLLLVVFIYKIGSFIWRTLGVLVLIFLLWVFRDDLYHQAQQLVTYFHWDQLSKYFTNIGHFFQKLWHSVSQWIANKIA